MQSLVCECKATVESNLGMFLSAMSLVSFTAKIEYKNIPKSMIKKATARTDNVLRIYLTSNNIMHEKKSYWLSLLIHQSGFGETPQTTILNLTVRKKKKESEGLNAVEGASLDDAWLTEVTIISV